MNKINWDDYFMNMVYLVSTRSKDENTHIGAVVVNDDHIVLSTGYNSFVRGIDDNVPERQERPEKYYWFEHAERNAIYSAANQGVKLKGSIMYTNGIPCADCCRAIVQAGIKKVIVDSEWDKDNESELWKEHSERSIKMFNEAGVTVIHYVIDRPLIQINSFKRGKPLSVDKS